MLKDDNLRKVYVGMFRETMKNECKAEKRAGRTTGVLRILDYSSGKLQILDSSKKEFVVTAAIVSTIVDFNMEMQRRSRVPEFTQEDIECTQLAVIQEEPPLPISGGRVERLDPPDAVMAAEDAPLADEPEPPTQSAPTAPTTLALSTHGSRSLN